MINNEIILQEGSNYVEFTIYRSLFGFEQYVERALCSMHCENPDVTNVQQFKWETIMIEKQPWYTAKKN